MASTGLSKPKLFVIHELGGIHQSHPPIGKALQAIVDYINRNVQPVQGTKVAPK